MWRYLCLLLNSDQVSCEQLAEAGDILGKQRKSEPQQPVAHSAVSDDLIRFLVSGALRNPARGLAALASLSQWPLPGASVASGIAIAC
jgi:hypothetical protein